MSLDPLKDFYYEDGKMVLTSHFLSKRGFCCNNGCRHCPYVSRASEEPRSEELIDNRIDVSEAKES